jgi:tocopherol cyclase
MHLLRKIRSLFNPEEYQGWGMTRKYFEGWYFKVVNASETKALYPV